MEATAIGLARVSRNGSRSVVFWSDVHARLSQAAPVCRTGRCRRNGNRVGTETTTALVLSRVVAEICGGLLAMTAAMTGSSTKGERSVNPTA